MRLVRSEMLEVMRTDYIKFGRARGLSNRAINFGHALKNTLVPVITVMGLQLGTLIAFAIVTETVFAWPGVGQLFMQSVQFSDIPVMAAYLLLIALLFVIINLVVDLLYFVVDPRLRSQGGAAKSRATDMAMQQPATTSWLHRVTDSDIWWSFKSSPTTVAAAAATLFIFLMAFLAAPAGAAHAVRSGDAQPQRRPEAAGPGLARRRLGLPARHRRPGQGRAELDHVRHAAVADRGLRLGDRRHGDRHRARPGQRLCRRRDRRGDHARRRRPAHLPGDPGGAADRRRGARHHLGAAPRRDRHVRHHRRHRPQLLGAVRAHGARLGPGREEQGVRPGRPRDRPVAAS